MTIRLIRLLAGLVLYGIGVALTVEASLGLDPWTVLAEGVAVRTGIGIGWVVTLLGGLILLVWIPLRERPGVGTVLNILIVGPVMQLTLDLMPPVGGLAWRILLLLGGIVVVGFATALYIGAHFGPGPRDGLMTGLHRRFGWRIWRARATVELTVLGIGWLLGGTVGWGTLAYALLIGPAVDFAMRVTRTRPAPTRAISAAGTPAAPSPA
ncbi:hypothetical protein [Microbacterium sp. NPDC096154]|uniref:membrane protein YczE n=1 Tax=Microbacterium sp. NPDC096154 TaxID=3155549 RepID=UPI0033279100